MPSALDLPLFVLYSLDGTIAAAFGKSAVERAHAGKWGPATTRALLEVAAAAGITVNTLSVQSTTLDDVFVHYTGRDLRDALQEAPAYQLPSMRR